MNQFGIEHLWANADAVAKFVALLLVVMSAASWYVIILKALSHLRLRKQSALVHLQFWKARSLPEAIRALQGDPADATASPFAFIAHQSHERAQQHQHHHASLAGQMGKSEWLATGIRNAQDQVAGELQSGMSVLASVSSTAPFVGLFGTVWGIYHALASIGAAGQASLDKVAGPVGEALIMTALGLAVAIPAALGYNALVRANKLLIGKVSRFGHELHGYLLTGAPATSPHDHPMGIASDSAVAGAR
jgi:biopolymer transport protein ExbB